MTSATSGDDGQPDSAAPAARRRLIFGPEPWRELARGTWSHWDLWFCTLAITGFDCDWARLGDEIVRRSPRYLVGLDWEAKLSHLEDLRARLAAADLDAAELASEAAHDKKVVARARRKVLDQPLQGGRDLSPAMRATPRERLWCRAMHGHWDRFPVSPAGAHDEFAETVKRVRARGRGAWGIVQVYFTDLCELCVWENHGLLYQRETAPFASVAVEHRDLVEALLWSLATELRGHRLGYPAEVAMALVAYLQAATGRLDRLVATAERLGSDQWMPVVALAQAALAAERRDLALEVFAAADCPGLQQACLASRCLELTGEPPPRRHLRAVQ